MYNSTAFSQSYNKHMQHKSYLNPLFIYPLLVPPLYVTTNSYGANIDSSTGRLSPSHCAENQEEVTRQTLQRPAGPLSRCHQASCAGLLLPLPLAGSRCPLLLLVPGSPRLGQGLQDLRGFHLRSRE